MEEKKLSLKIISVESFITTINSSEKNTIVGGINDPVLNKTTAGPTEGGAVSCIHACLHVAPYDVPKQAV